LPDALYKKEKHAPLLFRFWDLFFLNLMPMDRAEKKPSLRTEIPRPFIEKYLQPDDVVLDAGGGTGINAIMMAQRCQRVTLVDLSPRILELAATNVQDAGLAGQIDLPEGDIIDLGRFDDETFSFIVCVGDAVSYALDKGPRAVQELARVAKPGAILVISCDSKYGFMRGSLSQGLLDEVIAINASSETYCSMGPRTRLYTVDEMTAVLQTAGCKVLEVASTPTLAATIDRSLYSDEAEWQKLKALELEICTQPELLGMGAELLFVARKIKE
jgi:ubiquinone/menaquinone biosynthesis C-methylase UbiE